MGIVFRFGAVGTIGFCFGLAFSTIGLADSDEKHEPGATVAIEAVQHVKRMRGGAQSHLMRASDGHYYVVKFQNNPQHLRVLANELLATKLGELLGLPVPQVEVVAVGPWLVDHTPELRIELVHGVVSCVPGLQCGSRYVVPPAEGIVYDFLPEHLLERVRNLDAFAGALILDKWTCNADGRQAAFWKRARERKWTATFIDQGYCFNAGEWSFPDSPLRGVYGRNEVYRGITSWNSFEPWLSRLQELDEQRLWQVAEAVPPTWYGETCDMERLIEQLIKRRNRVPELILDFKNSSRQPFPNWAERVN